LWKHSGLNVIWRKTGIASAVAASAVALSGCVAFISPPTAKEKHGSVVITVKGCATQMGASSPPPGSCTANNGNSGDRPNTHKSELFLGFRVSTRALPPHSFSATTGPTTGGPTLHFTASKAYAAELQRLDKAPSGQVWLGYTSQYFPYDSTTGQQNFTAKVTFGLKKKPNGKPAMRIFRYEVVVGGRQVTSGRASRKEPIDCESSLTTGHGGPGNSVSWVCVDDSFSSSLSIH
jgi:hypothetical protein